ncbi:MAG: hypothetical protein ACTSXD_11965 [Candidatus Heimdallarchaeaceae archaeon]
MEQLKYVGNNKPKGMIIEVEDSEVKRLLASGNYEKLNKPSLKTEKKEEKDDNSKRIIKRL